MWCNPCRAVGIIHCAHPDECGNMLSDEAAADNWKAWLDDLPLDAGFSEGIGQVQDFISGTVARPKRPPTTTITTADELRKLADQYEVYEKELQVFNVKVKEYGIETGKLLIEFQEKLKEDYGLCNSEFAVLWDEAYEKGHSGGIQEIYQVFDDLYYFVKKYVQTMKGL